MSATPVEIFVPCRTFKVRAQVGPAEALSPLSELMIRAIHEGLVRFDDLVALFQLGERVTLDLIYDLWRDGHVVIDMFRGLVALTAPTARLVASAQLDRAQPSGIREDERELMQERLTGMVLSTRHGASVRGVESNWRMPSGAFDVAVNQMRSDEIVAALRDDLRRADGRRLAEGDKVLSASLTRASLRNTGRTSWLSLVVRVERDSDLGEVAIEVVPGGPLSLSTRREMGRRLASFCEAHPKHAFVQRLLRHVARRDAAAASPEQAANELLGAAEACATVTPPERAEHQRRLDELADQVAGDITDRRAANAERRVITTAEHNELFRDMLRSAERQVVIASPWIRERSFQLVYTELAAALERGVQVFILWGIKRVAGDQDDGGQGDARLRQGVGRLIMSLRREHPGNFHVSTRSAATHAKLAIQDDRRALVTSYNLLSRPDDAGAEELGILLTAPPRPQRCGIIEQLLSWARSEYPEHATSGQIYVHAEAFFPDHDGLRRSDAQEREWPRPEAPPDPTDGADPELDAGAARIWHAGWSAFASRLAALLGDGAGRAIGIVLDGEHRLALRDALATPCKRLVVASHRIGNEVIDRTFLDALDGRLDEGTRVALLFAEGTGVGLDVVAELQAVAARHPEGALQVVVGDNHSKLLVVDDRVTITSFNFLAFQGFYESLDARGRRRQRTELGLTVTDARTADAVVAQLNASFPDLDVPRWEPAEAPVTAAPAADDLTAVSELAEAVAVLADGGDLGAAAAVATRSKRPAALLDQAERLGALPALQRALIARALRDGQLKTGQSERWTTRLVRDLVADRDLVGAAMLRAGQGDLPGLPEQTIMLLMAGMDTPSIPATIEQATALPQAHPDWQSLGILGADRLVVHGDPDAEVLVVASASDLSPHWRAAVADLFAFWERFHRALPLDVLSSAHDEREAAARRDVALQRLRDALQRAERRAEAGGFARALWAREVHGLVHRPNEPIGRLREACDDQSADAVRSWVEAELPLDLDALVDDAAQRLGYRERLHRGTRTTYLKDLREAVGSAKDVARQQAAAAAQDDPAALREARAVVTSIGDRAEVLRKEAVSAEPAVSVVLDIVLTRWLAFARGIA